MNWIDILKATFRPADEPLSPSPKEFLTKPEDAGTRGAYSTATGKYQFNLENLTPEEIAQVISEETTHHAQNVIGNMDEDYKQHAADFSNNLRIMQGYIVPILFAKLTGNETSVPVLLKRYIESFFSLLFSTIVEKVTLESHAKESQNLDLFNKLNTIFPSYVLPVIDTYFSILSGSLESMMGIGEHFDIIRTEYNAFKQKLLNYSDKVVEDIVTEAIPDRKRQTRKNAIAAYREPIETTKTEVKNAILSLIEGSMTKIREELNA